MSSVTSQSTVRYSPTPQPLAFPLTERLTHAPSGRTLFVQAFLSPNKDVAYPEHQAETRKDFLKALNTHLSSNELSQQGPYVIGQKVTYADLGLYQILHDEQLTQNERKDLQGYPKLIKLVDAVEARPNVKAFLNSERYLG